MRRINPAVAILVAATLLLVVLALLLTSGRSADQEKVSDKQAAATGDAAERRCVSKRTYDLIKQEVFRRSALTRGSDQAAFDRLSSYSVVRMDRPLLTSLDKDLGTIRCSGQLSIDLPPGVAVVGGRRTLSAKIDYVLQPAADGSGDVVILEGADSIVVPLATLAQIGSGSRVPEMPAVPARTGEELEPTAPTGAPVTQAPAEPVPQATPPAVREPAPPVTPTMTARPSFNCRYARTGGEIAVCNNGGLAALDRQMATQYYRAIASANARQRQMLTITRDRFLRYRDQCRSEACIAQAYRGRIQEINDIAMAR